MRRGRAAEWAAALLALGCILVGIGLTRLPYTADMGDLGSFAISLRGRGWIEAGLCLTLVGGLATELARRQRVWG